MNNIIKVIKLSIYFKSPKFLWLFFCVPFKKFNNGVNTKVGKMWDGADINTVYDVFIKKQYDCNIKNPRIIVDLGANVGFSSIFFAKKYPDATIYAFEPDPFSYEKLIKNVKRYNIKTFNLAISDKKGQIDFYHNVSSISSSIKKRSGGTKYIVNSITLTDIPNMINEQIDILKFDIEGAEYTVFKNNTIDVRFIIGEYHEDLAGYPINEFQKILKCQYKNIGNCRYLINSIK